MSRLSKRIDPERSTAMAMSRGGMAAAADAAMLVLFCPKKPAK